MCAHYKSRSILCMSAIRGTEAALPHGSSPKLLCSLACLCLVSTRHIKNHRDDLEKKEAGPFPLAFLFRANFLDSFHLLSSICPSACNAYSWHVFALQQLYTKLPRCFMFLYLIKSQPLLARVARFQVSVIIGGMCTRECSKNPRYSSVQKNWQWASNFLVVTAEMQFVQALWSIQRKQAPLPLYQIWAWVSFSMSTKATWLFRFQLPDHLIRHPGQ